MLQKGNKIQIKQKTNVQLPLYLRNRTFEVVKVNEKEMMIKAVVNGNDVQPMNILGFDYLDKYTEITVL